jgi:hypothetical protein
MLTLSTTSKNLTFDHHHAYVHTRVLSEQRNRVFRPPYTRSQRQSHRVRTKRTLQNLALATGETELGGKLQRCYGNVGAITCGRHLVKLIPDYTCGFRLCPDCARRRASKIVRKYLPAIVAYAPASRTEAMHLVLTQSHRVESLKASVKRITQHFKALRRRAVWQQHFKGGLFAVEFTIDQNGLYHTHLHILAFRTRFFDVQLLKDAWLEITGDSTNLRINRLTGEPHDALREVLKYAVKPACIDDFTTDHFRDFLAMTRQRLFGTFGDFQKFAREYTAPPDAIDDIFPPVENRIGEPCSVCGEPLMDVRLRASDISEFLERLEAIKDVSLE